MNLRSLDLNLLLVLLELLEQKNVSQAAKKLHMSQPAVSRALQRLRQSFNDPLLIRTAQGYDLSARAAKIHPKLSLYLNQLEQLLSPDEFDPKEHEEVVTIYSLESDTAPFLARFFSLLREQAPNISLRVRSEPREPFELLDSGEAMFCITPYNLESRSDQYFFTPLGRIEIVCLMRKDHPLAHGRFDRETFLSAQHALVAMTGEGPSVLEEQEQTSMDIKLYLSNFNHTAAYCEQSDLIFTLPKNQALEVMQGREIVMRELPLRQPLDYTQLKIYWHQRHHNAPICIWLRNLMKSII